MIFEDLKTISCLVRGNLLQTNVKKHRHPVTHMKIEKAQNAIHLLLNLFHQTFSSDPNRNGAKPLGSLQTQTGPDSSLGPAAGPAAQEPQTAASACAVW